MNIIALICARSGSKGVPNKNIKLFAGEPLITRSIKQTKEVKEIKRVIVSTDSEEIANIAINAGAEVPFMRPDELAKDDTHEWLVWRHAMEKINNLEGSCPDILIVVPVTAPLRVADDLKNCLVEYQKGNADIIITVTESHRNPYFNMVKIDEGIANPVIPPTEKKTITRRQECPSVFDMTTVAYVTSPKFIFEKNGVFDGKVGCVHIPIERALDIDTPFDFRIAELLLSIK
jgi:N-acylneuraminate cytidylyltransferase